MDVSDFIDWIDEARGALENRGQLRKRLEEAEAKKARVNETLQNSSWIWTGTEWRHTVKMMQRGCPL